MSNYKFWTTDEEPTEAQIAHNTEYRNDAGDILTIIEVEGEDITPESQVVKDWLEEMGYEGDSTGEQPGGHIRTLCGSSNQGQYTMTDRILITFHLTRAERDLLDALAGTGHRSKFLRDLILEAGKRAGLELPSERLPERGKYQRE